jgi:hypothetical protein
MANIFAQEIASRSRDVRGRGVGYLFVFLASRVANVDDGGSDVDRLLTHGAIDVTPLPQWNNPEISGSPDLYIGLRIRGETVK